MATRMESMRISPHANRVIGVEIRKDDSGGFRGSIFVTFADPAHATAAAANPPLQLGSSTERLQVWKMAERTGWDSFRTDAHDPITGHATSRLR